MTDLPIHPTLVHPHTGEPLVAVGVLGGRPIWPVIGASDDDDASDDQGDGVDDTTDDEGDGDAGDGTTDALGDKGKRALDAMKVERNAARRQYRDTVSLLATKLKTTPEAVRAMLKDGTLDLGDTKKTTADKDTGDGVDADQIRADAERAATAKANRRIIGAELKAAASGKLADPADASVFIDIEQFDVDENGDVDPDDLTEAISDLLTRKPHLAAKPDTKFGAHDGGVRGGSKKSLDEQIADAEKAKNFRLAISLKNQKLAEQAKQ